MRITLTIPTFEQGGMERVMNELSSYWADQGLHIDLIFLVNHKPFYKINKQLKSVSFPNFHYKKNVFSKFVYKLKLFFFLRKKYRSLKTDVVLSFGEGYNSFVLLSSLGMGISVFVSNRSNPLKKQSLSLSLLEKFLYPRASGILVQTSFAKRLMQKKVRHNNIILIPNPIKIIPNTKEVDKKNIILNIGRLVPEKDQLTLIRIFSEIEHKNWELHIIGSGPLRRTLEKEIKTLKMESHVKLLGSKEYLSPYMSKSSIFAFTSISEGYPNALCEAMAFPLPCIAFDCDAGPKDILINNENGFLIDRNNIDQYKRNLMRLMTSKDLRANFMNNAVLIRDNQTIDIIALKILEVLKKGIIKKNTH